VHCVENVAVRQVTDDDVIWPIHIAFWIPKAPNTLLEYVILI